MHHDPATDTRLTNLEIKASFTEDLLDDLNRTVFRQQQQIDRLLHELAQLRQRVGDGPETTDRQPRDDLPPHY